MNKYIVSNENTDVEFADLSAAQQYALENSISVDQIVQAEYSTASIDTDVEFSRKIDNGFLVSGTTCSLALYEEDRAIFSTMLTLVNEALEIGQMTTESQVSIKCLDGNILYMSAIEFKTLMMQYGFYYKSLWDQKNFA